MKTNIKDNAFVPEPGLGRIMMNKMDESKKHEMKKGDMKMDMKEKDTSIRNAKGQPTGLKQIGQGWGGEPLVKQPKIKPMKFKMSKKGIISKKK